MTTLTTAQESVHTLGATDSSTPPVAKPAGFSAQVSNYPDAYIALVGANQLHFVPKAAGTFTVTINGHSQDGTALPSLTLNFTVTTPPVPQATTLTATDPGTVKGQDITTPADPGTDTVTGNV